EEKGQQYYQGYQDATPGVGRSQDQHDNTRNQHEQGRAPDQGRTGIPPREQEAITAQTHEDGQRKGSGEGEHFPNFYGPDVIELPDGDTTPEESGNAEKNHLKAGPLM